MHKIEFKMIIICTQKFSNDNVVAQLSYKTNLCAHYFAMYVCDKIIYMAGPGLK